MAAIGAGLTVWYCHLEGGWGKVEVDVDESRDLRVGTHLMGTEESTHAKVKDPRGEATLVVRGQQDIGGRELQTELLGHRHYLIGEADELSSPTQWEWESQ